MAPWDDLAGQSVAFESRQQGGLDGALMER